jgi:hypothetical protein
MLAVPLLAIGCKQAVLCPVLDSCGGDPSGDWVLAPGNPSCSEDLYTPPVDPRLIAADLPPARTPPPEPALYDWCDFLVTSPQIPMASAADPMPKPNTMNSIVGRLPTFSFETFPIGSATIHYGANHSYVLSTTRTGEFSLDFPAYCMRAFGAVDTPFDPNAPPGSTGNVCQKLQDTLRAITRANLALAQQKYRNITCMLDPRDAPSEAGCLCGFEVQDIQESSGTVIVSGSDMLHLPGNNFPEDVSFCASGNTLQLTGGNGEYLFDRVGLRTLDLVKATVNCTDGLRGTGEDGVDCGPACPVLCGAINCTDMVQGPGEAGIDCGPNCPTACP